MVAKVTVGGVEIEEIGICVVCCWEVYGGDWVRVTNGAFSCSV